MRLSTETEDGVLLVSLSSAAAGPGLDWTSRAFVESLLEAVGHWRRVVLDLSNIQYINSRDLGILVAGSNAVIALGAELRLVCTAPALRDVFRVTRLDRIYTIEDGRASAVRSLCPSGIEG